MEKSCGGTSLDDDWRLIGTIPMDSSEMTWSNIQEKESTSFLIEAKQRPQHDLLKEVHAEDRI
eukprot:1469569-Prorocentrum_lima.AAC.1